MIVMRMIVAAAATRRCLRGLWLIVRGVSVAAAAGALSAGELGVI